MFELNNETIVRGFVAHLQSLARQRAMLVMAALEHPDATKKSRANVSPKGEQIIEQWEIVRRDIFKVLGVQLKPWHELTKPGRAEDHTPFAGRDELRITMRVLKAKCDKARRKDPSITLMKSWDLAAH